MIYHCSPPNTVIGIETTLLYMLLHHDLLIAALLIPSSVLKPVTLPLTTRGLRHCSPPNTVIGIETSIMFSVRRNSANCSPPNTVIGIETIQRRNHLNAECVIAALLIPSSVLKRRTKPSFDAVDRNCSPPNTVIGIETSMSSLPLMNSYTLLQPS